MNSMNHPRAGRRTKIAPGSTPKLWAYLLLLPLTLGCVVQVHRHSGSTESRFESRLGLPIPEEHNMVFRYTIYDGHGALETERVVLVFHGLSLQQQRLFHFQGDEQAVQVEGAGSCAVSRTCASGKEKVAFRSEYSGEKNVLTFGDQTVTLTQAGWCLSMEDQSVDLSQGRKVIHVKAKGLTVE